MSDDIQNQLKLLREPFPDHQISKLPKPTKAQTDEVKQDYKKGIRCEVCGGWHHPKVIHLDYVGHAALTDRLLSVDPLWNWEHAFYDQNGYPVIDNDGGMWIKLTVCGVTRLGYGDAQGKSGGDAMKERIGDALRNAAMRFGCALDLWHKGDLRLGSEPSEHSGESIASAKKEVVDYMAKYAEALRSNLDIITEVKQLLSEDDLFGAAQQWFELSEDEQRLLYLAPSKGGILTTEERAKMKQPEFSKVEK